VPVSTVDETASKLAIAFKHDKGLMADICNSSLVHIRDISIQPGSLEFKISQL